MRRSPLAWPGRRALVASCLLLCPAVPATRCALAAGDPPSPAARAEAKVVYASTCVSCHGPRGAGDGLAAAGLPVKPASFAEPAWQKSVGDAEIERAIVDGGAAVGKSPLMPPNPGLASKPQVVTALRELIRSFAEGSSAP